MTYLLIQTQKAWEAAIKQHGLEDVASPLTLPFVLSLSGDDFGMFYPDQAAKLLSVLTAEQMSAIPVVLREVLAIMLKTTSTINKNTNTTTTITPKSYTCSLAELDSDVPSSATFASSTKYNPGEHITLSGVTYIITAVHEHMLTVDPVTGIMNWVEVSVEGEPAAPLQSNKNKPEDSPIPMDSLQALPVDPSKFETKHKIADAGDPAEHVLDVERAI